MKKIIGLLTILFITTGVFGQQPIRDYSFIEATNYNSTVEDGIQYIGNGLTEQKQNGNGCSVYDWIEYVHFIEGDKLFLLSYEPKENPMSYGSRSIYLYRKDINDVNSPWEKASGHIMMNSYNSYSYSYVDFYRSSKNKGCVGEVIKTEEGIEISVSWVLFSKKYKTSCVDYTTLTYLFKPHPDYPDWYTHERIKY